MGKWTFEKIEWAIKNGQSRYTVHIWHNTQNEVKQSKNTTQWTK